MIGALAYFGVLDPTRFLPQRCQFGAELHCERFTLDDVSSATSDVARFELKNALPQNIYVNHTEYKLPDQETWTKCAVPPSSWNVTIKKETSAVLNCSMSESTVDSGEKQRVQFKIVYSQAGDMFDNQFANDLFGEIYANVR